MPAKSSEPRKPPREEGRRSPGRDDGSKAGPGFEQRLQRLEQLAGRLREGKIPLEEAVAVFEEGMKLSRALEQELARVERRVEILTREPGEEGEAGAEPGFELFPELGDEEKE